MKKRMLLFTLCFPLLFGACSKEQEKMEYIGAERAKALALTASGLSSGQVASFDTDMHSNNGIDYYQVEFEVNGEKYRYDVDALTGVIIDSQISRNNASQEEENNLAPQTVAVVADNQPVNTSSNASADASRQGQNTNKPEEQSKEMLTEEAAKNKALEYVGLTAEQVTFVKSGLDREDGKRVYDIEFYTENYEEYDCKVDPYTGEVLEVDYDAEYYTAAASDNKQTITADEAKALALAQVPGATLDDIREFETDYDDGRLEYEGKIYYDYMEYEFEIDGYSGAIRNWDVESIFD